MIQIDPNQASLFLEKTFSVFQPWGHLESGLIRNKLGKPIRAT
jgi:hypothetical protein